MCGKDVNSYIGGEIPIIAHALLVVSDVVFTSVVATSVQAATVALIGTSHGALLKAVIDAGDSSNRSSRVFRSIKLTDGTPLLQVNLEIMISLSLQTTFQDMEIDEKNGLIFAMSASTVYKVNYRQCTPATDCRACLEQADPA